MEANLKWDSSKITNSKEALNECLGVADDRMKELLDSVDAMLKRFTSKVDVVQTLIEGGIVKDAHELIIAFGYFEFVLAQQEKAHQDTAKTMGHVIGFLVTMIKKGSIDQVINALKQKIAAIPSNADIAVEVDIETLTTEKNSERKDSKNESKDGVH